MKKILCLLLCLAALFALSACGGKDALAAPYGYKLASDTKIVDYALFVPMTWTVDKQGGVTSAYYSEGDPSSVTVTLYPLPEGVFDLDGYWENYKDTFTGVYGTPKDVAIENTLLDGYEARQYAYTLPLGGAAYKFMQTVCIRAGAVYVITYASTAENFDLHLTDIETSVNTFTFTK